MAYSSPQEVVLDTDIGSDVDDLLALAMVLGSPEWHLTAVATVYGDTVLRARMVRRAYRLANRPVPPIAAGAREPLSGRPAWWAGHEGALMPDLHTEPVDETRKATAILRTGRTVAAIGPVSSPSRAAGSGWIPRESPPCNGRTTGRTGWLSTSIPRRCWPSS
jgi:purine nucleosidase